MLQNRFAPIKRAGLFFGVMGVAVTLLTLGAGFQDPGDTSSESIARAKIEQRLPTDARFAAIDPRELPRSASQRAVSPAQQAQLAFPVQPVR